MRRGEVVHVSIRSFLCAFKQIAMLFLLGYGKETTDGVVWTADETK